MITNAWKLEKPEGGICGYSWNICLLVKEEKKAYSAEKVLKIISKKKVFLVPITTKMREKRRKGELFYAKELAFASIISGKGQQRKLLLQLTCFLVFKEWNSELCTSATKFFFCGYSLLLWVFTFSFVLHQITPRSLY